MNNKERYVVDSDEHIPEYLHEVTVNGHKLSKGMQVTLSPQGSRVNNRRYKFEYAENWNEVLMLTFFGPVLSKNQRYRVAREDEIVTVHVKTRGLC